MSRANSLDSSGLAGKNTSSSSNPPEKAPAKNAKQAAVSERADPSKSFLTLKAMCEGAHTTPRAVRLYEAENLIAPAHRSEGGHRLFAVGELEKLKLIIDLRGCGFSIEDIRKLLLARSEKPCRESALVLHALLERHLVEIRRKLALISNLGTELAQALSTLERCAHCDASESEKRCASCGVLTSEAAPRCIRFL